MDDDLLIDADAARGSPAGDGGTDARGRGAWTLLSTSPELVRALSDRGEGLAGAADPLHPTGAVLAGDLAEMQPSDLLNFLHQGRRTGVLLARSEGIERGIVLVDGNVAWACSNSAGERLGELLCRVGLADRAQIQHALRAQQSQRTREQLNRRRLGQLLVEAGALSEDVLTRSLKHQTVEIFLGLLVARSGNFVFLRGVEKSLLPTALALDTQALLLDGLRRLDEMELYRARIPSGAARPAPTGKPLRANDDGLTPEARALLPLCDGQRTIEDLARLSALGEFEATKAAYKLLLAGHVAV